MLDVRAFSDRVVTREVKGRASLLHIFLEGKELFLCFLLRPPDKPGANSAVLMAMHDLTLAARYCQRLVMLAHGRVIADGPPAEILTDENIFEAYSVHAEVIPNPVHSTPLVLPYSNDSRPPA